jgi:hypothetical protein
MTKTNVLAVATVAVLVMLSSCEDDPAHGCDPCPPQTNYQNLTQKEHVLNNLELSYNQRKISEYDRLLDENFTMYFSPSDFNGGKTPEQWGRQEELDANTNLFNPAYNGVQPRCLKIFLDLKTESGLNWVESDAPNASGEKWYTATVFYNFQFDIEPDLHLINNPSSKAQFTVRNISVGEAPPRWELVEMRDLDGSVRLNRSASATEQSSWGQIKTLYH